MSICAIVGTMEEEGEAPISGTGKTNTMVYLLHEDFFNEGKEVYTNLKSLKFGHIMRTFDIFMGVKDGNIQHASIGIDNLTTFLNSFGTKGADILFSEKIMGQMRNRDNDMYWTGWRFKSAVNRVRHFSDTILISYKTHEDYTPCYDPKCKREHLILVYSEKPFIEKPVKCLIARNVGQFYDTYEFIDESLNVPTQREIDEIKNELKELKKKPSKHEEGGN
jgi:hypothetical protein